MDWSLKEKLEAFSKRRQQEQKEWNEKLPPPNAFIPDPEMEGWGIGFWKATDGAGVVTFNKKANGYVPESRQTYTSEFIAALEKANATT